MPIDFDRINATALHQIQQLLEHWLPGGEVRGHDYCALNPMRADSSVGSFQISLNTGQWIDFASDDRGKDLIALRSYLDGRTPMGEAARKVAAEVGYEIDEPARPQSLIPVLPPPEPPPAPEPPKPDPKPPPPSPPGEAPPPLGHQRVPEDAPHILDPTWNNRRTVDIWNPRQQKYSKLTPSWLWTYRDAHDHILGHVIRINKNNDEKVTLPATWGPAKDGHFGWLMCWFAEPRPLYGLNRLAKRPDAPVIVCEGEKATNLLQLRWTQGQYICVTSPCGSKAARKADWSPLAGRRVIIWPDYDEAGARYAADVAQALQAVGASSIAQVDVTGLQEMAPALKLTTGFDAADVPAEVTTATIEAWLQTATPVEPVEPVEPIEPVTTREDEPSGSEPSDAEPVIADPGPVPHDLLHVPGFVSQVMDYCLSTAPYPNPVLAFCGAMALQSLLAGRCVRDEGDNRSNLYLLGLANSGAGKDHPRKVNQRILLAANLAEHVGDSFASGEGIEDRLLLKPTMLFQTDEMDALLIAIREGLDGRSERIMQALLKFYSSANGIYPMRVKAGAEPMFIDQPSLSLFGTAIPQHFYESLSAKMLSNGFFARMLVLEAGKRGHGQRASTPPIPPAIGETVRWWREFQASHQGSTFCKPDPITVPSTDAAVSLMADIRRQAELAYTEHESKADQMGMAIWARAAEKVHRLALCYACSEKYQSPIITAAGVQWAWHLTEHQTKRMIAMATAHVYDGEFDQRQKKVINAIRAKGSLTQRQITRVLRNFSTRDRDEIMENLLITGQVVLATETTKGRPRTVYQLPVGP